MGETMAGAGSRLGMKRPHLASVCARLRPKVNQTPTVSYTSQEAGDSQSEIHHFFIKTHGDAMT